MDCVINIISYIVLILVICIFCIMYIKEYYKNKKLQKDYQRLDELYDGACLEIEILRAAEKFKVLDGGE